MNQKGYNMKKWSKKVKLINFLFLAIKEQLKKTEFQRIFNLKSFRQKLM